VSTPNRDPDNERVAAVRSRRAFLSMGLGAGAAYGGWAWLRSRSQEGDVEWPLRRALGENERIAEAYFSNGHRSPAFGQSQVGANTRTNGDVGLGAEFEPERWVLDVGGSDAAVTRQVTLAQIRELPRVEQITELNCIEGWSVVARWAGARFTDLSGQSLPVILRG
jgi:DMSO/TMAO reductase YedYZ molybdopterin-dependent catalytic subunit